MKCVLTRTGTRGDRYLFACTVCGRTWDSSYDDPLAIRLICGIERASGPPAPPLFKRLGNFTVAAIGHVLGGMPTCTQEEIDTRYAICRGCELHRPDADNPALGICTHASCGCTVTNEDRFVSKLAWRGQVCPLGKWPGLSESK